MPDLPTRTDLFNLFADDLVARAQLRTSARRATASQIYTPGSDLNLIGGAISAMGEEIIRQLGQSTRDLTLDGSVDGAVDRFVADRYSPVIVRKEASPALVTMSFTRPTSAFGAFTYDAGARVSTPGGIQFELTTAAAFGASSLGPITAAARSVDAGIAGNVDLNTISQFITQPDDTSLVATNPAFASGGDSRETPAALKERARVFFSAQRRGVLAAIEFGALTVDGVRQATVEEEIINGTLTGVMNLYIADANGQANAALSALVVTALREYRCGGIGVNVIGATPSFVAIQLSLGFGTNVDTTIAFDQVRQVLVGRVNQLKPMATLYRALISESARSVTGVIVRNDSIVAPAGDIVPSAGQIIRTRSDLISAV